MKPTIVILLSVLLLCSYSQSAKSQTEDSIDPPPTSYFIDVHHIGEGKVTADAVAEAHKKDLETQKKYGVNFIKYWVDETNGNVYCLSQAPEADAVKNTHAAAHGMLPDNIYAVSEGTAAAMEGGKKLYLDIHEIGPGNVTAAAVAEAHSKDLAAQGGHDVNFINYWVNEKDGVVMCLSEANDSSDVIATHKEAHGMLPNHIMEVKQGE
ncbi:hypothetical protein BH20BAC1_BH20BAC1_18690 [soil metagenome]